MTPDEEKQLKEGDLNQDVYFLMKEKELKTIYEKFCFLNNFTERTISDPEGQATLSNYSFSLENDRQASQVFVKLVQ